MTDSKKIKAAAEKARRLAIWKQAEELNVPAFLTPLWQATYGKAA